MPKYEFEYSKFSTLEDLPIEYKKLLEQSQMATKKAYAPYSHFHVGCAVLLEDGQIVEGVNIENAAYPVGICAERSALSSAISQNPKVVIKAIAISYNSESGRSDKPAFPCGMCRQFIAEIEQNNPNNIPLILGGAKGEVVVINKAQDLLPFNFDKNDLK